MLLVPVTNRSVFVPLESVRDSESVQAAIASTLGSRNLMADPVASLCATLSGRQSLLVLDNFEQLIDAAPLVGTLLEQSSELTVLVTSRQLLRLRGEHELQVRPLPAGREGVALFTERAAAASHGFGPAERDVPIVAEICRRLDGVPLAIELAAPQVRLLAVEQLLVGLNRRLAIAGPRDAHVRERTLEAAIGWSYELLDDHERRAFERLGVFRGSFTLRAAAEVTDAPDALGLLGSLLDKSIVYRLPDAGETRFAPLTMIREYALERLEQAEEHDAAMEPLSRYHLELARAAETGMRSPEQRAWTRRLDFESDNIRTTLAWLAEQGRADESVALLRGLWLYWFRSGRIDEASSSFRSALADEGLSPADRGWAMAVDGMFAFVQGDYPIALATLASARLLLLAADDRFALALSEGVRGVITSAAEGYEAGRAQMEPALAGFEELGDDWGVALTSDSIAAERAGDDLFLAMAHDNLASRRLHERDLEGARAEIRKAIEFLDGAGIVYIRPDVLENLSHLAVLEELPELAAERLGAASALREAMRVPLWVAAIDRVERPERDLREQLGDERFEAALARGRAARFADLSAPPDVVLRPRARGRARSRA
jgi:predicted ATPase